MLHALESRSTPSYCDDPHGALFKLQLRDSINDYLTDFKRQANRTVDLAPLFRLSCFISGLTPELRRKVQAMKPLSLPQAVALAKLQDRRRSTRGSHSMNFPSPSSSTPPPTGPSLLLVPMNAYHQRN